MENKKVKMRRRDREITDNEKIKEDRAGTARRAW